MGPPSPLEKSEQLLVGGSAGYNFYLYVWLNVDFSPNVSLLNAQKPSVHFLVSAPRAGKNWRGLSMSEILQLSFISSKSRHLSALCVSEIMLGSLANNCDREGAKSHRGGTLIHTGSFKVRSGLLHNQLRPSDESTEHKQGPCMLIVVTKLIINGDIDHVNRKNGQESVILDQMFNKSKI